MKPPTTVAIIAQTNVNNGWWNTDSFLIVSLKAGDVLGLKLLLPMYWALIECDPAESSEVVKIVCPEFYRFRSDLRFPVDEINHTWRFFCSCAVVSNLAVNVICWPDTYSVATEVNSVVVSIIDFTSGTDGWSGPGLSRTTSAKIDDGGLDLKLLSPLYWVVIEGSQLKALK
jgi:hypothetical protein